MEGVQQGMNHTGYGANYHEAYIKRHKHVRTIQMCAHWPQKITVYDVLCCCCDARVKIVLAVWFSLTLEAALCLSELCMYAVTCCVCIRRVAKNTSQLLATGFCDMTTAHLRRRPCHHRAKDSNCYFSSPRNIRHKSARRIHRCARPVGPPALRRPSDGTLPTTCRTCRPSSDEAAAAALLYARAW